MPNPKVSLKSFGLVAGPLSFFSLLLFFKPAGLSPQALSILASTAWISIWWITEAIPIAVTSLLPIVLFPVSGGLGITDTTSSYAHPYIFLYMGGFMLSIAIEKWNLHKRIALQIMSFLGTRINMVILGFMMATAFLSMWISNTATAVMMLPIGIAIVLQMKESLVTEPKLQNDFGKALMLAIAYSSSIGGMATLIGTPPNLIFAGVLRDTYHLEISFLQWLKIGLPVSIILLFIAWKYLTGFAFDFKKQSFPGGIAEIQRLKKDLGTIKTVELKVLAVFAATALLWICRPLVQRILPAVDDSMIAVFSGILLFIIPGNQKGERLIKWEEAVKLPWGIILLFGGGMALAQGFSSSGLALWIGSQMNLFQGLSVFFLLLILVAMVNFLTEITSNMATTAMILPILVALSASLHTHPVILMIGATLAASCAFMLPVATPPNAVVFGSGYLRIPDMVRTGFWMNIMSIILISLIIYFVLPYLGIFDPSQF